MIKSKWHCCWFLLMLSLLVRASSLPIPQDSGLTGFGLALRKLPTVGSILYVTAHPDDENNALIARLSRGEGYRVGLLTLTRGDGGQNEIGPELFEALGVLRSEELMAVHRFDGAQQFFSRAFEFGYSFSVEETMEKWGREEIVSDIVRVIRTFRPTVMLTMSPYGAGGGQHHQASAILAAEAFARAGNPGEFPEQIAQGLRPWQPLRLYQPSERARSSQSGDTYQAAIDVGDYDPLVGESWIEFGARARQNHRSQGMQPLPEPRQATARYTLVKRADGDAGSIPVGSGFLGQVDVGLESLALLDPGIQDQIVHVAGHIRSAEDAFGRSDYRAALTSVMAGLKTIRDAQGRAGNPEVQFLLRQKELDFLNASEKGLFLYFEAFAEGSGDGNVVPGEQFEVQVQALSQLASEGGIKRIELQGPAGWEIRPAALDRGEGRFTVKVPDNAEATQPYWSRSDPSVDRFDVLPGYSGIEPFPPAVLKARLTYESHGVTAEAERPVLFRWYDASAGLERRQELQVVPRLSVNVEPALLVFGEANRASREVRIRIRNDSTTPVKGTARISVPDGWRADPASVPVSLDPVVREATVRFSISREDNLHEGVFRLSAQVSDEEGKQYDKGYREISYSHTQTRRLYRLADATLKILEVALPARLKVGYVMGVGDEVGEATSQLGAELTYLTPEDLAWGDLSRFDVIVTGVRAYLNRPDLIANNWRLLEYVHDGGHMVVQYNKYEYTQAHFSPYKLGISRPHDRVTVEESPVKILHPDHLLFSWPNQIVDADWEGWRQERGLYFAGEWDPSFTPLLELRDPWPYNSDPKRGSLLIAQYGKGSYIYTGLAFFRQLPEGVGGAYRLWANLISCGKGNRTN